MSNRNEPDDSELDPGQLALKYGYWQEHPSLTVDKWATEVVQAITRAGYWEWVAEKLMEDNDNDGKSTNQ
jgi:hypothetical protein